MTSYRTTTKNACTTCPAVCCRNLAMLIGKPSNREEINDLKWQLHYDTVKVYIRNRRWYQLVEGKCIYLDENNLCTIYSQRPNKCRQHNPPDCETFGKFYDVMFSTPAELEDYFEQKRSAKKNRSAGRRSPTPASQRN